jgi:tetratricopeptide (TPR) repeat protein
MAGQSFAGGAVLIGRDGELAQLAAALRSLSAGRGGCVLVEGEPGIGKSALVNAGLAQAVGLGCQVFWGTGDELGQALPLLPLLDALRLRDPAADPGSPAELRREAIARVLRGEPVTDPGTDGAGFLAEQLLALIADECAVRPTILVIDDLQWADQDSVRLLGRLARSAGDLPLLLVAVMRPVPQRDDLLMLRRGALGEGLRLRLQALSSGEATQLIAALAGGVPDGKLRELAGDAAGNPLYLTELVDALARGSAIEVTEAGVAQLTAAPVPGSLAAAIADRLDFVSGATREVLRAAVLLGVEFAVPDLAVIVGRSVLELMSAIDEATAAGVLEESGTRLRFRHPLIRQALYETITVPARRSMHARAGRALAEAGASADRVARQLLRAYAVPIHGEPAPPIHGESAPPIHGESASSSADGQADEWVLGWLDGAAELLVSQAPQVAARLLERAVEGLPVQEHRHVMLASRLADAYYRLGDRAAAEAVASRALRHAEEPDLRVDLQCVLAHCWVLAGQPEDALAILGQALESPGLSERQRARLLMFAARTHCNVGQVGPGAQVAAEALTVAEKAGDTWAVGWSLLIMALAAASRGDNEQALALYDRAMTVTHADPSLADLRLLLQVNKAGTLGNLDRHEEAVALAAEARRLADQVGTTFRASQAHSALGQLLFETGRWDGAMAEMLAIPADLKEPAAACVDLGSAALICFHRGDFGTARRYLAAAGPYAERIGNRLIPSLELARSLDREQAGSAAQALAALATWCDGGTQELGLVEEIVSDVVRLGVRVGDRETARVLAGQARQVAAGSGIPHREGNALYCTGLVDRDAGQLLAAASRYAAAGRPLPQAMALEAAAAEWARAGEPGQAAAALARAREIYAALGATADAARVSTSR